MKYILLTIFTLPDNEMIMKVKPPLRFISYCVSVKVLKSSVRCAKAMFIDVFVLLAYLWVDVQDGLINPGLM